MERILANAEISDELRTELHQAFQAALAATVNSASETRAIAQTLATVIKPRKPDPYDGKIDAEECRNFIENQAEYFNAVRLNEVEWVRFTALHLTGPAKSWWRDSGLTDKTPWSNFKKAFIDYFTPPDSAQAARRTLDVLKQNKFSIPVYTEQFRRLLRLIPGTNGDQATVLDRYIEGLEEHTRREVRLRQPTTLDEAISQATIIHSILNPPKPLPLTAMDKTPNTMAMEIDNLQLQINALTRSQNHRNTFRYNNGTKPLQRLDENERKRLYERGACFKCRKDGHLARDCRVPRNFNNISTEGSTPDSTSGKAPGNQE